MKYIIFDFNGTILDDVDLAINCLNKTIDRYLDRKHVTLEEYKEIFTFPVKKYYEAVGFDFDVLDWYEVGKFWADLYYENRNTAKVHDYIKELLIKNREIGNKNILLSASKLELLIQQVRELGLYEYFDEILGIDNIYASSKLPIGLKFIKDKNPEDCVFIGDTGHDFEVAKGMGVRCILVASGHESKSRLLKYGCEVYDSPKEIKI